MSPKMAHKGVSEFRPDDRISLNKVMESSNSVGGHVKFFFARHPFDRLVSVYVQKFELGYKDDSMYKGTVRHSNYD